MSHARRALFCWSLFLGLSACGGSAEDGLAEADEDPDMGSESDADRDGVDSATDAPVHADSDVSPDSVTDAEPDGPPDVEADVEADAELDVDADAGLHADRDADAGMDALPDVDPGLDAEPDADTGADAEPDPDVGMDAAPDSESDAEMDAEPDVPIDELRVEPTTLDFGTIFVDQVRTQSVTVDNLTPNPVSVAADHRHLSATSDCGLPVPAGARGCTVTVQFAPTGSLRDEELEVTVGEVAVSVTAAAEIPSILGPWMMQEPMSALSASIPVTFENHNSIHTGPLRVSLEQADEGLSQTSDCSAGIAPGGSCTVTMAVDLDEPGSTSAQIRLLMESDPEIYLRPTLFQAWASFRLGAPESVFAGNVELGTHADVEILIANEGTLDWEGLGFDVRPAPEFEYLSDDCPDLLAAGEHCELSLRFTPAGLDFRFGSLTVTTGLGSGEVELVGRGDGAALLEVPDVAFGPVPIGRLAQQQLTIRHRGGRPAENIELVGPEGTPVELLQGCRPLREGQSCTARLNWTPDAPVRTEIDETWSVTYDGGNPIEFQVTGTVSDETLLSYTDQLSLEVGWDESTSISFPVTSPYTFDIDEIEFEVDGDPGFSLNTTQCDGGLPARESCRVFVRFEDQDGAQSFGRIQVFVPGYDWNMPQIQLYGGPPRQVFRSAPTSIVRTYGDGQWVELVWLYPTRPGISTGRIQVGQRALAGVEVHMDDCTGISMGGADEPDRCRIYTTMRGIRTRGAFEVRAPNAEPLDVPVQIDPAD